jgi:hypothetical protein
MINAHFYTSVGEFVATFADAEEVYNKLGVEGIFNTPQGEGLMIPMEVQKNSVIVLKEVN